jgi:hypothetical protein
VDSTSTLFNRQLGKLVGRVFLQSQVLLASSSSTPFPQHDLPIHKRLFHNLAFGRVREYSRATCILAPFFPALVSFDVTSAFITLHPGSNGYFLLFLEDYELDQNLKFSSDSFKLAF